MIGITLPVGKLGRYHVIGVQENDRERFIKVSVPSGILRRITTEEVYYLCSYREARSFGKKDR